MFPGQSLQSRKVRAILKRSRQRGKKEMSAQPCMRMKQMTRRRIQSSRLLRSFYGKKILGDTVLLCAEVRNIPDGTDAVIRITEQDDDGTNDAVAVLTAAVSNGRILCAWDVVYTADNDDSSSAQELQEKGYTVPEYVFTVECGGVKSGKSPLLEVMCWIRTAFRNNKTGKPLVNRKYRIYLYDGTIITGKTDNNGYVDIKTLKQGQYFILMER